MIIVINTVIHINIRKLFSYDTERRAISLRQLSFSGLMSSLTDTYRCAITAQQWLGCKTHYVSLIGLHSPNNHSIQQCRMFSHLRIMTTTTTTTMNYVLLSHRTKHNLGVANGDYLRQTTLREHRCRLFAGKLTMPPAD